MSEATTTLEVARGGPGDSPRFDIFEVPYTPGATVLDALNWIREHRDASLAFRFSCISANVCKECVMRINGRNGYACTQRLGETATRVEPLAGKRLIRDLVCATVPPKEQI